MDSHTDSTQVHRLEVVQTGRRRRWSEDEKLRIVLESRDCRKFRVRAAVEHQAAMALVKRSPKRTAN